MTENISRGLIDTMGKFSAEALKLPDNPAFELLLETYGDPFMPHLQNFKEIQLLSTYN